MFKLNPLTGMFDLVNPATPLVPAGSDRQIQINDGNLFGVEDGFSIDASGVLSLPTDVLFAPGISHSISIGAAVGATDTGDGLVITSGNGGATSGAGGFLTITAGSATTDGDGGDLNFAPGAAAGTGVPGKFTFNQNTPTSSIGILDFASVATSPKTFSFPNASGIIALTSPGVSDSFTTVDLKTVTVVNGVITSIV